MCNCKKKKKQSTAAGRRAIGKTLDAKNLFVISGLINNFSVPFVTEYEPNFVFELHVCYLEYTTL